MVRRIWRVISIEMYSFWLNSFSFFMWFWLARSISGRSQVVRMISGVDKGSEENVVEKFRLFSSFCHRRDRLTRLTRKL